MNQQSFSDIEYSMRKKTTKREEFLDVMEEIIPWEEWVEYIRPYYPNSKRGRPTKGIEKMLRMYLHRKSSVRCKVEHPFHYLKNKFGFKKVRYRGIAKNLNKLNILFACINLIMRDYALKHSVQPTG